MKNRIRNIFNKLGYDIVRIPNQNDKHIYTSHFGYDSVKRRAFYNISAGGHFGFGGRFDHPLWTNVDVDCGSGFLPLHDPSKDIIHDPLSLDDLPIESNSAELCQSRFAIEHIDNGAALKLFQEVHRILKRNGIYKIVVPNFRLDYNAYKFGDRSYFYWQDMFSTEKAMDVMGFKIPLKDASFQQLVLAHFAANASTIHVDGAEYPISDEEFDSIMNENSFEAAMDLCTQRCSIEKQKTYRKNHINWWDHDKVKHFLKEAGFKRIIFLSPGQSISPVMRKSYYFDNLWNEVALYVEAVK